MCESLGTSCNVVLLCVKEGTRNDRRENVGGGRLGELPRRPEAEEAGGREQNGDRF